MPNQNIFRKSHVVIVIAFWYGAWRFVAFCDIFRGPPCPSLSWQWVTGYVSEPQMDVIQCQYNGHYAYSLVWHIEFETTNIYTCLGCGAERFWLCVYEHELVFLQTSRTISRSYRRNSLPTHTIIYICQLIFARPRLNPSPAGPTSLITMHEAHHGACIYVSGVLTILFSY
jgi:hypothetical protein